MEEPNGTYGLMASRGLGAVPSLTIAIPHYKHRRYLELVLQSLFDQTSTEFEILISDDCSPGDSNEIIPTLLEQSGRPFQYHAQPRNLGYDGNVRFCLRAAAAPYVMLLGNDDALADRTVVEGLIVGLKDCDFPEVAVTNYRQWGVDEIVTRRVFKTGIIGTGPAAAVANFRMFSFVSGLIYRRDAALVHETDRWDASVFYQIYLACRVLAAGGRLAGVDCVAVSKDVKIAGDPVPSYATKFRDAPWTLAPRDSGLRSVMRVTVDAITPYVAAEQRAGMAAAVIRQTLVSSYLFWLCEYRRVANWAYSFGLARGLAPNRLLTEYRLPARRRLALAAIYGLVTIVGLMVPLSVSTALKAKVAEVLRARQQRSVNVASRS